MRTPSTGHRQARESYIARREALCAKAIEAAPGGTTWWAELAPLTKPERTIVRAEVARRRHAAGIARALERNGARVVAVDEAQALPADGEAARAVEGVVERRVGDILEDESRTLEAAGVSPAAAPGV
jgi:hypothetical protein